MGSVEGRGVRLLVHRDGGSARGSVWIMVIVEVCGGRVRKGC